MAGINSAAQSSGRPRNQRLSVWATQKLNTEIANTAAPAEANCKMRPSLSDGKSRISSVTAAKCTSPVTPNTGAAPRFHTSPYPEIR